MGVFKESYRKYISVTCVTCNATWNKRRDSINQWDGQCKSCASKELANRPEFKARLSENARAQVIRQGGVPNAKKFTAERVRGAANCKWRGGVTPEHKRIRHSAEYVQWRKQVFERDNYTCQICGERGGKLHADHIKAFAYYPDLRFELSNGRALCISCHRKTPNYGSRGLTKTTSA